MSKYIDLYEEITEGEYTTVDFRRGVVGALDFLDSNPDQVPGRTIAHSEYRFYEDESGEGRMSVAGILHRLGIKIVPDPEPTNAEKLENALRNLDRGALHYSVSELARDLDNAGVKAPTDD